MHSDHDQENKRRSYGNRENRTFMHCGTPTDGTTMELSAKVPEKKNIKTKA